MTTARNQLIKVGFTRRQADELLEQLAAAAGGGGGAPQHQEAWTSAIALRSSGEGGFVDGGATWNDLADPETSEEYDWCTVGSGGDAGRLLLDQGWYDVRLLVSVTWPASTAVTYVRSSFQVGNAAVGNHEEWTTPVLDANGVMMVRQLVNLGTLYSDGFAKISPSVRWNTGVTTTTNRYMHASITKLG